MKKEVIQLIRFNAKTVAPPFITDVRTGGQSDQLRLLNTLNTEVYVFDNLVNVVRIKILGQTV